MKFTATILLTIVALVSARAVEQLAEPVLPKCAQTCLTTAITATGCTGLTSKCACDKSAELGKSAGPCLHQACSDADFQSMLFFLEVLLSAFSLRSKENISLTRLSSLIAVVKALHDACLTPTF